MQFGFMNVILLYKYHRHVSANHLAIFSVVKCTNTNIFMVCRDYTSSYCTEYCKYQLDCFCNILKDLVIHNDKAKYLFNIRNLKEKTTRKCVIF
jgi:hypothetical protein